MRPLHLKCLVNSALTGADGVTGDPDYVARNQQLPASRVVLREHLSNARRLPSVVGHRSGWLAGRWGHLFRTDLQYYAWDVREISERFLLEAQTTSRAPNKEFIAQRTPSRQLNSSCGVIRLMGRR